MKTTKLRTTTEDTARYWAKTGADILFAETDPFEGTVSKEKLEQNLYNKILINIVEFEIPEVSEAQLKECIELSRKNVTN